jgi:hypothetical protein
MRVKFDMRHQLCYPAHMRTIRALRRSLSSTGLRLLLLVLVAASPVLVVRAVSFRTDRQAVREHSGDQVLLIARLAAAQQRSLVSQAQKLAIAMAGSIEARSDPVTCGRWLAELLERNPSFASFGIARPTGEVWCSGRPAPTTVFIADRPYFQEALRTGDVAIGEY